MCDATPTSSDPVPSPPVYVVLGSYRSAREYADANRVPRNDVYPLSSAAQHIRGLQRPIIVVQVPHEPSPWAEVRRILQIADAVNGSLGVKTETRMFA